jgi:hypothetical protein
MTGGSETWLRSGWYLGIVLIGVSMVLAGWSLVVRYRRSDLVGRQQLKWFVYGMTVLLVTALLEMAAFALLPRDSALGELSLGALFVGASLPPLAAAVAIMRYGLYEIDVLINRTFVFGALTAVLAGLYAAGIRLFQSLFVAVTGQESDGALVLTTLVLATTFTPIKSRLESVAAHRYALPGASASATARSVVAPSPASQPEPATDALPGAGAVPDADALRALIADVVREELDRRGAHAGPPGEGT